MMPIGIGASAARGADTHDRAISRPDVAACRTTAPSLSDGAVASPQSSASTQVPRDRIEHARAATALVVRRHALMPRPGGFWIEALPRTLLSRGGGTLPGIAGCGTAFLVTTHHVVTAAHVIDRSWIAKAAFVLDYVPDCLRLPEGRLPLRYEFAEDAVLFGAGLIDSDPVAQRDDIRVVELTGPARRNGIPVAPFDAMSPDQPVAMLGCARMEPVSVATATGDASPSRVLWFDERLVKTSVRAFQGNSGSALLDARGDVLGVHIGMVPDGSFRNPAISAGTDGRITAASAVRLRRIRATLTRIGAELRH